MVLCLMGIAVLAYYLFYHEPSLEKIDFYSEDMIAKRDSIAQSNIQRKNESRVASMLRNENDRLAEQISALRHEIYFTKDRVKQSISDALERCGSLELSFDNQIDMDRKDTKGPADNKANFRIQGSFRDVLDFLDAMPGLRGIPHAWTLKFLENKECLDFWMEMEFTS